MKLKRIIILSIYIIATVNSYSQKVNKIIVNKKVPWPIFKNESDLVRHRIMTSDSVANDYDIFKRGIDTVYFKEEQYIFNTAIFQTLKDEQFKIGFDNKIIYVEYKDKKKSLFFDECYDVKFFGYRKSSDESDFYFCLKDINEKRGYFYFRFFPIDKYGGSNDKIYITFIDHLPFNKNIRNYCDSEYYWNLIDKPR